MFGVPKDDTPPNHAMKGQKEERKQKVSTLDIVDHVIIHHSFRKQFAESPCTLIINGLGFWCFGIIRDNRIPSPLPEESRSERLGIEIPFHTMFLDPLHSEVVTLRFHFVNRLTVNYQMTIYFCVFLSRCSWPITPTMPCS